jgi:hypothetical protein
VTDGGGRWPTRFVVDSKAFCFSWANLEERLVFVLAGCSWASGGLAVTLVR